MTMYFPKWELCSRFDMGCTSLGSQSREIGLFLCHKAKLGYSCPGCSFLMLQFVLCQELAPPAVLCPGLKPQMLKGAAGMSAEEASGKAGLDEVLGRNSWL